MKLYIYTFFIALFILNSCSVEPKKIKYGEDHCHYCDMTVVDKTHASEYVTKKGRAYTFDAIECLVNDLNENKNEDMMSFILVANYSNPGELIPATEATYLISKSIKSPMGANLSAFKLKEKAIGYLNKGDGKLYNWEQLKTKFSK